MLPETLLVGCKAKESQSIREHTDKVKAEAYRLIKLGCITSQRVGRLLIIACEYHDYGKVNREFVERIEKKYLFRKDKEVAHNILSYFFIDEMEFDSEEDYMIVAAAVLYHHSYGDSVGQVMKNQGELIDKLLEPFSEYVKIDYKSNYCHEVLEKRNPDAILVKGLLHRCDYSASAGIPCEFPHDFLEEDMEHLLQRWREKNPHAEWNDLQVFCRQHRDENILIVAPTGMGKTEAALLWLGNYKGFFVLPLRTAINAMYKRIETEIIRGKKEESLALLHSDTMSIYIKDGTGKSQNDPGEEGKLLDYYTRSRQMALPLTICTLDQLFNFVYKYPGYEYKLATLSYSKIIIDEIQMYDPELLAYLIYGLAWIHEMGGKVAVLTATMPPFARQKLQEALGGDFVEADFSEQGADRHHVKVFERRLNAEEVREFAGRIIDGEFPGNRILVVCNSIEIAQRIYEELGDIPFDFPGAEVSLLHSGFTRMDRAEKEGKILSDGKAAQADGPLKIWVATSVVEASLDIDFDYLFTELNDLFSLFQRFGRCNRKGQKPIDNYNCFVYLEKQGKAMKYVDETIYRCSRDAILHVDGILTEQAKNAMIEEALSAEKLENSKYRDKYVAIYEYIEDLYVNEKTEKESKLRNIPSVTVIPESVHAENREQIEDLERILDDGAASLAERIKARDGIYQYTVSMPKYRYEDCEKAEKSLKLGKREEIPIIRCSYNSEKGLMTEPVKGKEEPVNSVFI